MINKADIDGNGNIIIQNADNSIITVNSNNPEELKRLLIDLQNQIDKLPLKIIKLMEEKKTNDVIITGANVHLELNFLLEMLCNKPNGKIGGISFSVTITNLTKENRFFNAPSFKPSVPIEGGFDCFMLTEVVQGQEKIKFPKKLEYGEVVSQAYYIRPDSKEIFDKLFQQDSNATIVAIVSTTIGEIYKSNEYKVSQLLENFKYAR